MLSKPKPGPKSLFKIHAWLLPKEGSLLGPAKALLIFMLCPSNTIENAGQRKELGCSVFSTVIFLCGYQLCYSKEQFGRASGQAGRQINSLAWWAPDNFAVSETAF
ncbi:hypothetical protein AMECASPLE_029936 [Ameca splendens]|uniref:Uncharacterized protein n=1 Tax=Ameca splendens TaxID=208324 RepID=A0ABV0XIW9_9TELE